MIQNNLQIFVVFTNVVKILTSDAHKKIIDLRSTYYLVPISSIPRGTLNYILNFFECAKIFYRH